MRETKKTSGKHLESEDVPSGSVEMLALAAQQGDQAAYEELLHKIFPAVMRVARRYGDSAGIADDICQEVLIAIHNALPCYRYPASLFPWILVVARHKAIDIVKNWMKAQKPLYFLENDLELFDFDMPLFVSEILSGLSESERELLFGVHSGYSYEEIAFRNGASPGSLKVRHHRLLKRIRILAGLLLC